MEIWSSGGSGDGGGEVRIAREVERDNEPFRDKGIPAETRVPFQSIGDSSPVENRQSQQLDSVQIRPFLRSKNFKQLREYNLTPVKLHAFFCHCICKRKKPFLFANTTLCPIFLEIKFLISIKRRNFCKIVYQILESFLQSDR